MNIKYRAFEGPADFPAMVACANASFAADDTGFHRTVEDVARDYASFTSCNPLTDVWIAQAGEEVAGYVRVWEWMQTDGLRLYSQLGVVSPRWRRQGIGATLHRWVEARQREMAAVHGHTGHHAHHVNVTQGETARMALLEKAGYEVERYFFVMVRPDLDAIADFPLPAGVELRPVQPKDYRAIWDASVEAFRTHWAHSTPDEADFQAWQRSRIFQPHLWQVAWDIETNQVAGQVRTYIDEIYNAGNQLKRGWTEFISVREPWRRRGIARALISHSLRAQRAAGMQDSGLGVDSANQDGANRIYEQCGFVVTRCNRVYRKPLLLPAP